MVAAKTSPRIIAEFAMKKLSTKQPANPVVCVRRICLCSSYAGLTKRPSSTRDQLIHRLCQVLQIVSVVGNIDIDEIVGHVLVELEYVIQVGCGW